MPDEAIISEDTELVPVKTLSRSQRRVLGVLIEKGITTSEYYPLTLKAITTGCNQKNNRSPLTEFSEKEVAQTLEELRELSLVSVVNTESGRAERFRHLARKRFPFNEPQLAIMTELWLRGRQAAGELRSRANRMIAINSLDHLRIELKTLLAQGFIQSNGSLDSRGVEVDHNFYSLDERKTLLPASEPDDGEDSEHSGIFRKSDAVPIESFPGNGSVSSRASVTQERRLAGLDESIERLEEANAELRDRLAATEQKLVEVSNILESLRRDLGN